jgi:hypothetical protein
MVAIDERGHVAVHLFFFLREESVICSFPFNLEIVHGRRWDLIITLFNLFERDQFSFRIFHLRLWKRFCSAPEYFTSFYGGNLVDSSAFRADDRAFPQIEKLGAAIRALALGADFRLGHVVSILRRKGDAAAPQMHHVGARPS